MTQTERQFQQAVLDLAHLSGWESLHIRTSMQQGRYLTATTGTMAKGWPDLVLAHRSRQRILVVELKSDTGRLRPDQSRVLSLLWQVIEGPGRDWFQVHVWKPSDWALIEATLTNRLEEAA
jgi:hypothetical protein